MKTSLLGAVVLSVCQLTACGPNNESTLQDQAPQGVISTQQQDALNAANGVEKILLDSAEERRKQLEAQLQNR
ncbi:MAG: hypothetical protein JKY98_10325 [Gammaproteobacteria bacterium]|nr:hypothetical protein [Gammaproteobacteria bacterium]